MKPNSLFRQNIDPFCAYCKKITALNKTHGSCRRHGVVTLDYHCRHFEYDALKRVPSKPALLKLSYSDDDFQL